ncbi:hypothetical protein OPV22_012980 [Ensete ventricosum]|uniref:Uncharacterized protein n=1 Tax=Ensete ventricosum TaxID=4639 RepID=A0AAV8PHL5_ENSVE|nr:hypothetical protein OPV22_012980 [Ensete ventricosum]
MLARLQGGTKDKQTSIPPSTDRDRLVQFLSNLSASTEVHLKTLAASAPDAPASLSQLESVETTTSEHLRQMYLSRQFSKYAQVYLCSFLVLLMMAVLQS